MVRELVAICVAVLAAGGCSPAAEAQAAEASAPSASVDTAKPAAATDQRPTPEVRGEVVIIPLQKVPVDLLDAIETRLRDELDVEVTRREPLPLPLNAYYKPRRRYRAGKLLDYLLTKIGGEPTTTRVLGVTAVDISTTKGDIKDWGIFGLGLMPGRAAVISTYRLRRKARDRDHLKFRVSTTALHEIGHTFGLAHCTEARCPMQDAKGGIKSTDSADGHLGPECQAELDRKAPK